MALSPLSDSRLLARTGLALLLANARYWTSVAPIVRTELRRWQSCAAAIEDAELRALALSKLHHESFHADAAAMFATLAPRGHRRGVVQAIVALELLFDYLDGLNERPSSDPLHDGERLFATLIDAVAPVLSDQRTPPAHREDGEYPEMLSRAVAVAVARLPSASVVTGIAARIASRTAQAQTRIHAVPQIGGAQLEAWARSQSQPIELGWRELVASAGSSVLVLHALIAAAANPQTTLEQATEIESAYSSTCVLLTLLDGLVDYEQDLDDGSSQGPGYIGLYEDRELPELLCRSARRAVLQTQALPDGPHHVMLLTGIVAYYGTAPGARSETAKPALARLRCELAPLISPTLAFMRMWRILRRRAEQHSSSSLSTKANTSLLEGREDSQCNRSLTRPMSVQS
jgi:tetraprenyl-beta-curcumene synthase